MSFVVSLKLWKEVEKVFMRYLVDYPWMVSLEFSQGKCKDYDIKMTTKDKEITYEVKSDRRSEETGNCCIEYMYKWQASWIFASKADYIVYYCNKKWWIQERWLLIALLMDLEKEIKNGGDGKRSRLFLFSVDKLPELFEEIPELPEMAPLEEITWKNGG